MHLVVGKNQTFLFARNILLLWYDDIFIVVAFFITNPVTPLLFILLTTINDSNIIKDLNLRKERGLYSKGIIA